jgi:hypothetical protein
MPAPVANVVAAANAGDRAAFLDCFTSDGIVDDWGREFRGDDGIGRWSDEEFIGKQVSLEVTDVTEANGQVTIAAQVGGNGFNGLSHFSFRIEGQVVSRMIIRG